MTDDDRPAILVSACLLGTCCNHEGRASPRPRVQRLAESARLVPVCPEVVGGLTTPRPAAEIEVATARRARRHRACPHRRRDDVTDAYLPGRGGRGGVRARDRRDACGAQGAQPVVRRGRGLRRHVHAHLAPRSGVTAAALRAAGIDVVSDEELEPL